jgi:hypothetical protein
MAQRRAPVVEHPAGGIVRPSPDRHGSCQPAALGRERHMPDRKDASMHTVQAPRPNAAPNPLLANASAPQLMS